MPRNLLKIASLWLPPLVWALIIFKFSSGVIPQVSSLFWPNFAFMKAAHIFFFSVLAILLYRSLRGSGISRKKSAIWAVIMTILYGVSDEFHQIFTQGREARIRDVIFDGVGASLAIYLIYRFINVLPKKIQIFLLKFDIS